MVWWWQAFLFMKNATATITITETDECIRIQIEYDPMPIKGMPASHAAHAANAMVQLFSQSQSKDALVLSTSYNQETGETFTEDKRPAS